MDKEIEYVGMSKEDFEKEETPWEGPPYDTDSEQPVPPEEIEEEKKYLEKLYGKDTTETTNTETKTEQPK